MSANIPTMFSGLIWLITHPLVEVGRHKGDDRVIVAGIVSTVKKIITRKGESMLFVKLEDATNTVELLIFPRLLKETSNLWQPGQAVITDGKVSEKDQESKILVNRAIALDPLAQQKSVDAFKKIILEGGPVKKSYRPNPSAAIKPKPQEAPKPAPVMPNKDALRIIFLKDLTAEDLAGLRQIFSAYPGAHEVYFRIMENDKAKIIKTAFQVDNNEALRSELQAKFSSGIKIVQ